LGAGAVSNLVPPTIPLPDRRSARHPSAGADRPLAGLVLIVPAFLYLFRIFKGGLFRA
jgi:hypothetical protein